MPRPAPGLHARTELALLAFVAGEWRTLPEMIEHLRLGKDNVTTRRSLYRHMDSVRAAGVDLETKPAEDDARKVLYRGPAWVRLQPLFANLPPPKRKRKTS